VGLSFPYLPHYHYDLSLSRVFSVKISSKEETSLSQNMQLPDFIELGFWHGLCYVTGSGNHAAIIPREGRRRKEDETENV